MTFSEIGSGEIGAESGTFFIDEMSLPTGDGYAKGPERTLMGALLFDGIQAYINFSTAKTLRAKGRYREAYNWIHSNDGEYVFSFKNVCEALGIDAEFLRLGLANVTAGENVRRKRARRRF